jgi:hypothetical protein
MPVAQARWAANDLPRRGANEATEHEEAANPGIGSVRPSIPQVHRRRLNRTGTIQL